MGQYGFYGIFIGKGANMSKEIKVTVLDSTKLRLEEDASKGDIIDLASLSQIDAAFINNLIERNKSQELNQRIEKERESWKREEEANQRQLLAEHKTELLKLEQKIKAENQSGLDSLKKEIDDLTLQNKLLIENKTKDEENLRSKVKAEYDSLLKQAKDSMESQKELYESRMKEQKTASEKDQLVAETNYQSELGKVRAELEREKLKAEKDLLEQEKSLRSDMDDMNRKYSELQHQYDELNRAKSSLNVKLIGEDLESWCNEEFKNAQSIGAFSNCTWEKDNTLVKDIGESGSGTKADYLFRAYSDGNPEKRILLTSACMDMKSENPNSVNRKKNSDYFKKLDQDRNKKGLEYALLISELEMKSVNDCPIYKVNEYPKMYVVRPQYMMTFLGILVNLGNKYSQLIQTKMEKDNQFKTSKEIEEEFENFKNTYLDKPLQGLQKKVEKIKQDASYIVEKGNAIMESSGTIIETTLSTMNEKINTFSIKLKKTEKKINTIESESDKD